MAEEVNPTLPLKPKTSWTILFLLILTVFSLAISGYLFWQNQKLQQQIVQLSTQSSPSPLVFPQSSTEAETANWKTYTNNVFNYSLKVPNDYFVGMRDNINNINIENLENIEIFYSKQSMYYDNNIMYLGPSIKKGEKSLKYFAEANFRKNTNFLELSGLTYSTFNMLPAYTYTYRGKSINFLCDNYESFNCNATTVEDDVYKVILFEKNNHIFSIFYTNTSIFDQILSTFKFTE